jgi:hypothetical protein
MNILNYIFSLHYRVLGFDTVHQINPKSDKEGDNDFSLQKIKLSLRKRLKCSLENFLHRYKESLKHYVDSKDGRPVLVVGMVVHSKEEDKNKFEEHLQTKAIDVQVCIKNEEEVGIELTKIEVHKDIDDDYVFTTDLDYFPYRPSEMMDCTT